MPVKQIDTPLGHSLPPDSPHNITFHVPGWESIMRFRDGDKAIASRIVRIYPRFAPWGLARELVNAVGRVLGLDPETQDCFAFVNPDIFAFAAESATCGWRKEADRFAPGELSFRCLDIAAGTTRLYVLVFAKSRVAGVKSTWVNTGTGPSTRLCESLLPALERGDVEEVALDAAAGIEVDRLPAATWLPEGEAHGKIRRRIVGLLQRAAIEPEKAALVKEDDVFLYPTGMASIYRLHEYMMRWREGAVVFLGSIFQNTFNLLREAPKGYKHFGQVDGAGKGLDELEAYLEAEAKEGRKISYLFVEFPSNPILVNADLTRLRALADKYDFPLAIDDTIGSFSNVDVVPVADVIMSSTTKTFSGYANVMGGSLVLPPSSRLYSAFKPLFASSFHNEVFLGDAERLLANSEDYLPRSTVLNRNAMLVASYLHPLISDPAVGITKVLYPPFSDTFDNYKAFMRPPTEDFTPGYGCLLSVEFGKKEDAKTFFNNLSVFHTGHLGAHHTLALPFNELVLGGQADMVGYHEAYGAKLTQVRVSVGLEDEETILDTFKFAVEKVRESNAGKM